MIQDKKRWWKGANETSVGTERSPVCREAISDDNRGRVLASHTSHPQSVSGPTTKARTRGRLPLLSALVAIPFFAVVSQAQQNLLTNGDFENPVVSAPFARYFAPSSAIPGWSVVTGSVDLSASVWEQVSGRNSLDLDGSNAGAIEQTFPTLVGQCYTVLFALSGNPASGPSIKTMQLSAAGASMIFNFDITGNTLSSMGWVSREWSFTAVASSTTLRFTSLTSPSGYGAAIDNVRVFASLAIADQPQSTTSCPSATVTFSITASGTGPLTYQWRKGGVPIDSDGGGGPDGNPSAATPTLTLMNVQLSDADVYDCIVTSAGGCGSITSNPATLTICPGDFNCDGGIDGSDIEAFFTDWEAGNATADINEDGGIDGSDVELFFTRWEAGC